MQSNKYILDKYYIVKTHKQKNIYYKIAIKRMIMNKNYDKNINILYNTNKKIYKNMNHKLLKNG